MANKKIKRYQGRKMPVLKLIKFCKAVVLFLLELLYTLILLIGVAFGFVVLSVWALFKFAPKELAEGFAFAVTLVAIFAGAGLVIIIDKGVRKGIKMIFGEKQSDIKEDEK